MMEQEGPGQGRQRKEPMRRQEGPEAERRFREDPWSRQADDTRGTTDGGKTEKEPMRIQEGQGAANQNGD